ncbi:hypothetical protein [Kitasatospora purpeofusca]|uniref:hypothetical protein n=1 Tax=Kitasatospora purpeofusca TaxID=67352 RepID=UPI0038118106
MADGGFELVVGGDELGPRRLLQDSDVVWLAAVASRYVDAVRGGSRGKVLLALGRELHGWLDGDRRWLTRLLDEASAPVLFEVRELEELPPTIVQVRPLLLQSMHDQTLVDRT